MMREKMREGRKEGNTRLRFLPHRSNDVISAVFEEGTRLGRNRSSLVTRILST